MPRKAKENPPAADKPLGRVIEDQGVYRLAELTALLGLRKSSLSREVRERRLRVVRRCGCYFFIGRDVLEWLRTGAVTTN